MVPLSHYPFLVKVALSLVAAIFSFSLYTHLMGGWDEPPCIGPQKTVHFCR